MSLLAFSPRRGRGASSRLFAAIGALLGVATLTTCGEKNTTSPANVPVAVTSVSPASGPQAGGTAVTVTITGAAFPTMIDTVLLGTVRLLSLVRVSATQLTGTTPAGTATGAVNVTVYTTGAGNGTCTGCFTYIPAPTVTSVSPTSGPQSGGTALTITGTGFPATVDSVRAGTGRLGSLVRVSATQLTGTAPASSATGAVDVTVYTASAGNGTCAGCFTFNPGPTVTSVSPASGPQAGGTAVTMTGTNFPATVDSVLVGTGRLGSLVRVSATQLTGTTPASSTAGAVGVVVYSTSAGNGTCTGCFTYYPAPTVTSVSPTGGPQAGGTALTISGTNFPTTVDSVRVGTGRLGSLVRVSATQLTGITPSSSTAGAVNVTVYGASVGNGACTGCFTYTSGGTSLGTKLTVGAYHTCGLTSAGAAYCWGRNSNGQLGVGDTIYRTTPVAVAGGLTFASLTAGWSQTCGLTSGGAAYCWGSDSTGQLGDGSTTQHLTPVAVAGGLSFASLTAGGYHTCGLTSGGAAYCWGLNSLGALGRGDTLSAVTPVLVTGGLTFASLAASLYQTCALTSGGAAYCWGNNLDGQLGNGSTTQRLTPVAVAGGITFASLAVGSYHTCGVTSGGAAYCWGANYNGQLGDGSTTQRLSPVSVSGGITFARLTGGAYHTCGVTSGGAAYCWGYNYYGQLGDGSSTQRLSPVSVPGGGTFARLVAGRYHTCGVASGGAAYCWGYNLYGQLGDGSTAQRLTPVVVSGGLNFVSRPPDLRRLTEERREP